MATFTTTSGPLIPVPCYIGVSDANAYFNTRLHNQGWFNATPDQQLAALVAATRAIDRLNFVGIKEDDAQELAFPRKGPSVSTGGFPYQEIPMNPAVPVSILIACCEEAIVLLEGADPEMEIDKIRLTSAGYASIRETYSAALTAESVRAGIMSQTAWGYLLPWLADPLVISLRRV